jgi:hypothetical protein
VLRRTNETARAGGQPDAGQAKSEETPMTTTQRSTDSQIRAAERAGDHDRLAVLRQRVGLGVQARAQAALDAGDLAGAAQAALPALEAAEQAARAEVRQLEAEEQAVARAEAQAQTAPVLAVRVSSRSGKWSSCSATRYVVVRGLATREARNPYGDRRSRRGLAEGDAAELAAAEGRVQIVGAKRLSGDDLVAVLRAAGLPDAAERMQEARDRLGAARLRADDARRHAEAARAWAAPAGSWGDYARGLGGPARLAAAVAAVAAVRA